MDTKNSELYKIPIRVKELYELSINDIKELARRPRQERFHTDASGLIPNKEHKPVEKAVELFKSVKVRRIKKYNAVMRKQENPADLRISLCEARHRLLNTRPREGSRNVSAHKLLCGLRIAGCSRERCGKIIREWNLKNNIGLDEIELRHILDSAFGKDPYNYGCASLKEYCPYKDWHDCKHYRIYKMMNIEG